MLHDDIDTPIQQVFDTVINYELYSPWSDNPYMCNSLREAARRNLISKTLAKNVIAHINDYLCTKQGHVKTLYGFLMDLGKYATSNIPYIKWTQLYIYTHWDKRPCTPEELMTLYDKVKVFLDELSRLEAVANKIPKDIT